MDPLNPDPLGLQKMPLNSIGAMVQKHQLSPFATKAIAPSYMSLVGATADGSSRVQDILKLQNSATPPLVKSMTTLGGSSAIADTMKSLGSSGAISETMKSLGGTPTLSEAMKSLSVANPSQLASVTDLLSKTGRAPSVRSLLAETTSQNGAGIASMLAGTKALSNSRLSELIHGSQRDLFRQYGIRTAHEVKPRPAFRPLSDLLEREYGLDVELPTDEGLDRLDEQIESGELPLDQLEEFDAALSENPAWDEAVDKVAEQIAKKRFWTRRRARNTVVGIVFIAVTGSVLVISMMAPAFLAQFLAATGFAGGGPIAEFAGGQFDKRWPPGSDSDETSADVSSAEPS
ncbi:hypothetical protein [Prescottella equi]|uniref:Uncharacterized protein n=1 Tax=Rhodococcus hoagii TaxID=43767 RepID=A0AAE5MHN4_RHOHA|nr:hypothetical protein [Prescottella equi]ERN47707.1 hypothetical protein H849_01501 [Prescottella equi NBRC 101255 = C 7]MBM4627330.1 hypothetical protein [Prescottella equi]OQQ25402.1 hypothetical protein A6410_19930 [Prescottella equi]ORL25339.1 hypothetical protein A6I89_19715 [Prescottella equi]ORL97966.1 hypothetical protein A5N73_20245 [Prescottella equi]